MVEKIKNNFRKMKQEKFWIRLFSALLIFFTMAPFLTLFLGSLVPNSYVVNGLDIHSLRNISFKNYIEISSSFFSYEKSPYLRYLLSTLIICFGTVVFVVILSIFNAYFFSRLANKWVRKLEHLLIFTYFFPSVILIFAYFDIYAKLNLNNSFAGLIIANTAFCYPFSSWLLIGNFNEIPTIYDKSAILDGVSKYSILRNIIIRKSYTGIFTISLFSFVLTWNELAFAMNLTTSSSVTRPLSAGVVDIVLNQGESSQLGLFSAFGVITLTPLMLIFIILELKSHKLLLKENKSF